ncbi:MAG: hypothetical protein U9R44_05450 [Candidatus Omnitrophota bacterium]|nr:hypothetical protein [Candidatus Omnitrophota bacterium]
MNMKLVVCFILAAVIMALPLRECFADRRGSSDLLRQGLLGAGAGAVGGAASGAKGGDVWKGALAGAGVNIVGGALLDSMSGEKVDDVDRVDSVDPRNAYSEGYQAGYNNGYKKGYTDGYKEGIQEMPRPR